MPEEKPTQQAQEKQGKDKRKKINDMTLDEIDKKLDEVKQKMGDLTSRYALQLLKRKKELRGE
jgi:ribosomal protein L29